MSLLSLLSALAFAFYVDSAVRTIAIDPKASLNRSAFAIFAIFALWALDAFWAYSVADKETARLLYLAFSPTWNVSFGLFLRFCLLVAGRAPRSRLLSFLLFYLPGIFFTLYTDLYLVEGFVFRGGYWMASMREGPAYWLFAAWYLLCVLGGAAVLIDARRRSRSPAARRRYRLLAWTIILPALLGFLTDSLAMSLELEVPNLAIIWIIIWAAGIRVAVTRYGLFAPFPRHASREIVDAMEEAFYYVDGEGLVVWANRTAARAAGAESAAALRGMPLEAAARLDSGEGAKVRALLESPGAPLPLSSFGVGGGPAEMAVRHLHLDRPGLEGSVVTVRDLSEAERRGRAEKLLADAGRVYEAFLAHSLDGIVLADAEGRVIEWSASLERMSGIPAAEARGEPLHELLAGIAADPAEGAQIGRAVSGALADVQAGRVTEWERRLVEHRVRDGAGAERWLQSVAFGVPQSGGANLAMALRDVTAQKLESLAALEGVRRDERRQRLEAVGSLAAGLAHDFNNILAGITGTLSLLKLRLDEAGALDRETLAADLDIIEASATRATDIARRLLDLSRTSGGRKEPVPLERAVESAIRLCRGGLDPAVHVVVGGIPPEARVLAENSDIMRLLVNLIINANDAMTTMRAPADPRGGVITIEARAAEPGPSLLSRRPEAAGSPFWLLSVRDEGVGIPRDRLQRVFDPFFTTKGAGSATGLGLSIVESIARRTGGFAEILSEPGRGAEARVYLPAAG